MGYTHATAETIASDLLVAVLGLKACLLADDTSEGCEVPCEVELGEMLGAGHGLAIVRDERDECASRLVESWLPGEATLDASEAGVDPWFTTSGNNPVILDQASQADLEMSAGGWNLVNPELAPEPISSDAYLAILRQAAAARRVERTNAICAWIVAQTDIGHILGEFKVFWARYNGGQEAYKKTGESLVIYLTIAQKAEIVKCRDNHIAALRNK